MIFLIATQNKHKKVEFERILAPLGIEIKTAGELGLQYPDVEETGTTFEENALLKARAGCLLAVLIVAQIARLDTDDRLFGQVI